MASEDLYARALARLDRPLDANVPATVAMATEFAAMKKLLRALLVERSQLDRAGIITHAIGPRAMSVETNTDAALREFAGGEHA
jgi:hypothetical protein